MKTRYLLDSAILIDVLRGIEVAVDWVADLRPGEAAISVITRAEVLAGGTEAEKRHAQALCDLFDCISLDAEIADAAADLRRARRWKLPDAFQAAVAKRNGWLLVTRNEKDFREDRDRFVRVPYRL
jgi:hypothetical protein